MTATPQSMSTAYLASCLWKLHPTFRTRTYRNGRKVVFMTIRDATWADLYPAARDPQYAGRYPHSSDPLSYVLLMDHVRHVIPEAQLTSGGAGCGTWRLPDYVVHRVGSVARKKPNQAYRTLHRFVIRLRHADGLVTTHGQKDKGDRDPSVALSRAWAALAQLMIPGDRDVTVTVSNRGTGAAVLTTPVIALTPTVSFARGTP